MATEIAKNCDADRDETENATEKLLDNKATSEDASNRDCDRDQAKNDDKEDTSCVKFRNLFKPLKKWTGLPDCIRKVCSDRDQKGPKKPKIDEQQKSEEKENLLKSEESEDKGEETVDQNKEGEEKTEDKSEEVESKEVKADVTVEDKPKEESQKPDVEPEVTKEPEVPAEAAPEAEVTSEPAAEGAPAEPEVAGRWYQKKIPISPVVYIDIYTYNVYV